jgi:sugar/nucleoside kinase (ribokinase family)
LLQEKLASAKPRFKVVAMPDFYLDYVLSYPGKLEEMTSALSSVAGRGGGNILGWKHSVGRGGNSANLVAQLAKLGVDVTPIIETDVLGHAIIKNSLGGADLSHVKTTGSLSSTLSLEAEHSGRRVNVMVSHPGSHASFGPEKLTEEDRELIREANFVVVLNWGQNGKGTELAEEVFKIAREGEAVTFFDPGDPTSRARDIPGLNQRVLTGGLLDVLSVNENELVQLAAGVKDEASDKENPLFEAASVFSMLAVRVDLHTPEFSATFIDGQRERVPCLKLQPAKVTGGGDIWNAGDIFAQGIGLNHSERLLFANSTASTYLRKEDLEPPGMDQILKTVEELEKTIAEQTQQLA